MGTHKPQNHRKPLGLRWNPKYIGRLCKPSSAESLNQTLAEVASEALSRLPRAHVKQTRLAPNPVPSAPALKMYEAFFVTNQDFTAVFFYDSSREDWLELVDDEEVCSLSSNEAYCRLMQQDKEILLISHPNSEVVNILWKAAAKPQATPPLKSTTHRWITEVFNGQTKLKHWELFPIQPFDPFNL